DVYKRQVVAGALPHLLYNIKIDEESRERIEELRERVLGRTDLSLVFYFNHTNVMDPLLVGNIARRIETREDSQWIAPMSFHNTERRLKNITYLFMAGVVKACGIETPRVIQTYQVNNPKYGYTEMDSFKQNKKFVRRLRDLGKRETNKSVSMIISPEGTRTKGALDEGEKGGLVDGGSLLAPVLHIPIGIDFKGRQNENRWDFRRRVNIRLGEEFLQETRRPEDNQLEKLMVNLAQALPISRRGHYNNL
ncbi:MAG: hypothetical protein KIH89_004605, partial [Candidatus Shapirobacteria bacterium]|nr:hypothetical protein [Candidatus Shapirobacteria bacterium]